MRDEAVFRVTRLKLELGCLRLSVQYLDIMAVGVVHKGRKVSWAVVIAIAWLSVVNTATGHGVGVRPFHRLLALCSETNVQVGRGRLAFGKQKLNYLAVPEPDRFLTFIKEDFSHTDRMANRLVEPPGGVDIRY